MLIKQTRAMDEKGGVYMRRLVDRRGGDLGFSSC